MLRRQSVMALVDQRAQQARDEGCDGVRLRLQRVHGALQSLYVTSLASTPGSQVVCSQRSSPSLEVASHSGLNTIARTSASASKLR